MSRFGPDPHTFFDAVYQAQPPWDIGGPQPALSALFDAFPPASPVLDLGCASGDLSIHLARRGLEVLGVDFVATAVDHAREKAAALPAEIASRLRVEVADGLRPSALSQRFGAVVDSGFFHLFDPEQGERFVADLAGALRPGGRYYLLAFALEFEIPNVPRAISQDEIRARFTSEAGWNLLSLEEAEFLNRVGPPVPATRACIERVTAKN